VHSSVRIADAAIDYLLHQVTKRREPFFMYVAFNAPHDPRQAPREYLDLYSRSRLKIPPNFLPQHPFPIDGYDLRDEILAPYPRTPQIIQAHLQEYYAILTHLDAQIGRVLDALDSSGQADNTVVVFTSDQGLAVGQHGLMGKQNLYDHSVRMPFLLAGPGIPRGRRNHALFHMQTLFATTCDMARVPVPATVPLITDERKQGELALYGAYLNVQRSVRTKEWKLIRSLKVGQTQLFRVREDPWEQHNLATNPKYASVVARLDQQLRELMILNQDPLSPRQVLGRD
jgi:choline-sulfatase